MEANKILNTILEKTECCKDDHIINDVRKLVRQVIKELHSSDTLQAEEWISVEERPLFTETKGGWIATDDGDKDFIAALKYEDKLQPGKELWWVHHCSLEDETGLVVIGDDENEPAGWTMKDITHWMPFPKKPTEYAHSKAPVRMYSEVQLREAINKFAHRPLTAEFKKEISEYIQSLSNKRTDPGEGHESAEYML